MSGEAYVPSGATVLEDTVVAARMPWSGRIDRGEYLVFVDLEGRQAIDFLCFNAHDPGSATTRRTRSRFRATSTWVLVPCCGRYAPGR